MEQVIGELSRRGLRESVKVMVGGAAVTQEYADEIGADAYSPDCADAANKAKELVQNF
jgi:5-methyltetrahydrofolate--homocysteine methyltransferase